MIKLVYRVSFYAVEIAVGIAEQPKVLSGMINLLTGIKDFLIVQDLILSVSFTFHFTSILCYMSL